MTAADTYVAVLAELKAENTTSMTPDEFNYHIKVAQYEYARIRYMAYEQHQRTLDDLRSIHVMTDGISGPAPLVNVGIPQPELEVFVLPTDYMDLLSVRARLRYYGEPCHTDGTLSDYMASKAIQDNRKEAIRHSYYSKPAARPDRVYHSLYGAGNTGGGATLRFMAGSSIVDSVIATYLRKPSDITVDGNGNSVLNPQWDDVQMQEIVKWCVASYLEKIESMRTQTYMSLLGITHSNQQPYMSE